MTTLESMILSYLANALWQVPLLFAAGWLAARALRRLGPSAEHRVWVGTLLLQILLPAASTIPWEALRALLALSAGPLNDGSPHVSVVMGPGAAFGNPHLPAWLLAAIAIAYTAITAWLTACFAWRLHNIRLLRRDATAATLPAEAASDWAGCAESFGVPNASLASSSKIYGPITIGVMRKVVLLPPEMLASLPEAELRAAIAHEFAHMRRHDFLKNLLYELLSLPVRFHPVLAFTRDRLMETREMVCDQLAAGLADQHQYARSLLRLASLLVDGAPAGTPRTGSRPWGKRTPHAIGIFDATTFERRVMRLTEKPAQPSALRRIATMAACALLGAGICGITLSLSVHVDALAAGELRGPHEADFASWGADEHRPSQPNRPINVRSDIMAAQILNKTVPVYPDEAKKDHIEGSVKLNAIIGKTGEVERLSVISGPRQLQQSALDAVHTWTYKPFLLNGAPVEVKTMITVTYSLKK